MTIIADWSYPTEIRFGKNRINEITNACASNRISRPLLVTDRNLVKLEFLKDIESSIEEKYKCETFYAVDTNPTEINLLEGITKFKNGDHDGIVAVGGGSAIDLGKLIAFMVHQVLPVWDFEDVGDCWKRANTKSIYPIIAVPTTAGTGSEVGRASVLTNSVTKEKKIIFHPRLLPSTVLCDPVLTMTMPKSVTAGTGLDAFAHCVEAYCAPSFHPMSQGIALEGIKLVKENLHRAYTDGKDLQARSRMMTAAMMGAVAFQKGLGAVHALSHPIGAIYDTHHGMTNAVILPYVLIFNRKKIEGKINDVANYLEIDGGFDGFLSFVRGLNFSLQVPETLSGLGVKIDAINKIVEGALKDPSRYGNPKKLTAENTKLLLEECIGVAS
ncbi:MAG: iron-containing alcohol dehydrogenase [Pseudomonadota bacterium]|nr:iron-containing alcohol dehydrogenase [Pseudomonadota bacterium]